MGTRKENRLAGFVWAFVCALAFGLIACGDDSSSSPDEQSLESSSSEWYGDVSGLSSSSRFWNNLPDTVISARPGGDFAKDSDTVTVLDSLAKGDSLNKVTDTIPGNQEFSTDTDWISTFEFTGVSLDKFASPFLSLEGATTSIYEAGTTDTAGFMSPLVTVNLAGVTLLGAPAQKILLLLAVDLSEGAQAEVNLFKHLQTARAFADGWVGADKFAESLDKAAADIWKAFRFAGVAGDSAEPSQESIDAATLALHVIVSHRIAEGGAAFLDSLTTGIATAGDWADSLQRISVADWVLGQDAADGFAAIRAEIVAGGLAEVPEFEYYLREFYRSALGLDACNADNMDSAFFVGNEASAFYAPAVSDYSLSKERFVCRVDGGLAFMPDSLKDTYGFGVGEAGEVRVGAFTGNLYYTYDGGKWRIATEVEKDSYFVQMSATATFTDIKDVYEGIKPNERVIFVLRHAERGDDTSKSGSLTDNGKSQSEDVGKKLTKFSEDFLLGGSEFKRAHQTVEYIAKGRGQQYDVRDTFPQLNDDWYTFSQEANDKAKSDCNCGGWELTSKYAYTGAYTSGDNAAFYALDERSVELIVDVLLAKYNDPAQRFVVLSSHDKVMVPLVVYCTQGKVNLKKHDGGKWLNYLAGVAIIIDELGNRRYVPVKGLDSAYM